ncbi:MAG: alpha-amylase family glycosyl hydrolase, partial [Anaerolineae bacterium]
DQNRVIDQFRGDEDKARMAASILLTGTGVPFVYYGEEIGMSGIKPDEDIRRPMQWQSNGPKVGFTTGTPWREPADDFPVRSVERQNDEPDSLLNHYRALIHLRNEHEALRVGAWTLVDSGSPRIYAFLRQSENETILVVMNLNGKQAVTEDKYGLNIELGFLEGAKAAVSLFGQEPRPLPALTTDTEFVEYVPFGEIQPQTLHVIQIEH